METILQQTTTPINTKKEKSPFFKAQIIQKKLSIGAPNDHYEAEADAMADKVMSMSNSQFSSKQYSGPLVQRKCAACEEDMLQKKSLASEITPLVQRKGQGTEAHSASQALTQQIQSSQGGGHAMDKSTQNFMESRFGTDFSEVKIHTDSQAIDMSKELNAQAFTVGNDIYFNEGKYNPNSNSGKHLLAHELTHVLQQGKNETIRREPVTAAASTVTIGTILGWCLSGAAVTVIIDEIIQAAGWVWDRVNSGSWNIRQNWCKTLFSALFGCVFGFANGAIARMIFGEVASLSMAQLSRWVHEKLVTAGVTFLAGKWSLAIAKLGCDQSSDSPDLGVRVGRRIGRDEGYSS